MHGCAAPLALGAFGCTGDAQASLRAAPRARRAPNYPSFWQSARPQQSARPGRPPLTSQQVSDEPAQAAGAQPALAAVVAAEDDAPVLHVLEARALGGGGGGADVRAFRLETVDDAMALPSAVQLPAPAAPPGAPPHARRAPPCPHASQSRRCFN